MKFQFVLYIFTLLFPSVAFIPRSPLLYNESDSILEERDGSQSLFSTLDEEVKSALKLLLPSLFTFGDDLLSSTGTTLECHVCQIGLELIKLATHLGEGSFKYIAIETCVMANIPKDECRGVVDQQAPYVLQALQSSKNLLGYTGELFCNSVLSSCSSFKPTMNSLTFPPEISRKEYEPASATDETFAESSDTSRDTLTLLHLSDVHYDPNYEPGTEANCDFCVCCEKWTNPLGGKISHPASIWGEYKCDTPESLIQNFLATFQSVSGLKPDISIFTGDIAPHNIWYTNETTILEAYEIFDLFKQLSTDFYPSIGNHDTAPLNLFQPAALLQAGEVPVNNWVYNNLSDIWSHWLPSNATSTIETTGGVYSIRPRPGLKIINMNTNDCYALNVYIYFNDSSFTDYGQLQWIVNELADSEAKNEAVWLMSHVPPGSADCIVPWSNAFQTIVERYSRTIKAQFYGHTHFDEFAVQYNSDKTKPIGFQLWAPSLTPFSDVNAGYRMYKIDSKSFEIIDSLTYYADISQSGQWDQPIWQFEYSARDYYPEWPNDAPLNATFWDSVVKALDKKDDLFQKYYSRRSKSSVSDDHCDSELCKEHIITNLRAGNSKDKFYPPIIPNAKSLTDAMRKAINHIKPSLIHKRHCAH